MAIEHFASGMLHVIASKIGILARPYQQHRRPKSKRPVATTMRRRSDGIVSEDADSNWGPACFDVT